MIGGINSLDGFQAMMLNNLRRATTLSARSSQRMATGKRINSPSDDPSGFAFVSRSRTQLASIQQALANTAKVKSLASVAEAGLAEITIQLGIIQTKALEAAGGGLSQSQLQANQIAVDDAISAIDSIVATTQFAGKALLDGSAGPVQSYSISGLNAAQVEQLTVLKGLDQSTQTIDMNVDLAAAQASLDYHGSSAKVKEDATFTLTGTLGSATFNVLKDDSLTGLRDSINARSQDTGITASVSGNDLTFTSTDFGSAASVAINVTSVEFDVTGGNGDGTANGIDAQATINGQSITATGNQFEFRSNDFDFDLTLQEGMGLGAVDQISVLTTTSDNSLMFQIGPNRGNTVRLSISGVGASQLGGTLGTLSELATGGGKSLLDDPSTAQSIAEEAQSQLLVAEARVGSFISTTLDSTLNFLSSQSVAISDSISVIEDADLAEEEALKVKNDILAENARIALLSTTNFLPTQDMFQLLYGV